MRKALLPLFLGLMSLSACTNNPTNTAKKSETPAYPDLIKVHISGKLALPDSTKVFVNTDENTMQPLLSGVISAGAFVLDGELAEPNFYNLVVNKQKFKVFLENGKDYDFSGNVSGGKLERGSFKTNSRATQEYQQMETQLEQQKAKMAAEVSSLRVAMDNPKTYLAAIGRYDALVKEQEAYPAKLKRQFLDDKNITSVLKLFLIKEDKISKADYKNYHELLSQVPDSLQSITLFRNARAKVDQVRDFYEKMPAFPDISPRNPEGDSLVLANFRDKGTLLFVFWGSWNNDSRSDIRMIKSKRTALQKMGITPIYLTWDKDFDAWKKASSDMNLGKDNYRLNATDQDFMVTNYGVRAMPHYILVHAKDLVIIDHHFTYPLDGQLEKKLKNVLQTQD